MAEEVSVSLRDFASDPPNQVNARVSSGADTSSSLFISLSVPPTPTQPTLTLSPTIMSTQVATQTQNRGSGQRGRRGNRGRGGNRGGRGGGAGKAAPKEKGNAEQTPDVDEQGQVVEPSTATASAPQEEGADEAVCWICAEPVKYYALSECNHRTCHVCALRLRALYKKLECTFCKVGTHCSVKDVCSTSGRVGDSECRIVHSVSGRAVVIVRAGEYVVQGHEAQHILRDAGDHGRELGAAQVQLPRVDLRLHRQRLERSQAAHASYTWPSDVVSEHGA